MLELEHKTNK